MLNYLSIIMKWFLNICRLLSDDNIVYVYKNTSISKFICS